MKSVEDFLSKQIPGQLTVNECIAHAEEAAKTETVVEGTTAVTPSGVEIYYSWSPKRLYRVRGPEASADHPLVDGTLALEEHGWSECPSVTTVLNVLDKSGAIGWWSFRVGLKAIVELYSRGLLPAMPNEYDWEQFEKLIVQHKLSPNHVKDEAAGRGVNIHDAFEKWAGDTSFRPDRDFYPESEQGYVDGLNAFLNDITGVSRGIPTDMVDIDGKPIMLQGKSEPEPLEDIEAEVMVGSVEHGFAGRYDLRLTLPTPRDVVTKTYPKRNDKREEIPAGKVLLDLKTSKDCYPTHSLQLAAYEAASIECGYGPTDYRAVVHVTADGRYEVRRATATAEDFLTILSAHQTMAKKSWFV